MNENRRAVGQRPVLAGIIVLVLVAFSFSQNYNLVFKTYYEQYRANAWNSSEMGSVMKDFIKKGGPADQAWIVPFPFWVDTRLPPFWAGVPGKDIALARENINSTANLPGAKLFMFALNDNNTMAELQRVYPQGKLTLLSSVLPIHNFYVFRVPASP